jgi:hypothetical protein
MINITLSSKRKPNLVSQITSSVSTVLEPVKTLFKEAQRRDSIIKKLAAECPYKRGDVVKPSISENEKEYGINIQVVNIIDSYGKFGKNEIWPESDKPMIVYAFSEKGNCHFFCTTNYLKK